MVDTVDTRRTIDDGRRTMPMVWHKLPTGELKIMIWEKILASEAFTRNYKQDNLTW